MMYTENKTPIYKHCCGCDRVEYRQKMIPIPQLRKILGHDKFIMSSTYVSKECYDKFVPDLKVRAYSKLPKSCDNLETKLEVKNGNRNNTNK